jgi:multiple sugar transport system permease protein
LAFIGVIVAWPLIETIRLSFTDAGLGTVLGGENWVGFDNYAKLLNSPKFYDIIGAPSSGWCCRSA